MVYIKEDVMTNVDVNKIIADYMKYPISNDGLEVYVLDRRWEPLCEYFTDSLDALVPVWEKLRFIPDFEVMWTEKGKWSCNVSDWQDTIQEAAAYVTAKTIKELR